MPHIRIEWEWESQILPQSEFITYIPINGGSRGSKISFVVIVVNRHTCAVFQNLIVFRIAIHYFRITRFLTYQSCSSNVLRIILPNTISFVIPDGANRLSDVPIVRSIVTFHTVFVIVVIDVVDTVLVNRETSRSIPCKVFSLDISRVQGYFKTLVLHFTQVSGDSTETGETRQTLPHNHISSLLEIVVKATGQAATQYREIYSGIPSFRRFPLQIRSSQTVHIQRINYCWSSVVNINHTSTSQIQVGQRFVYVTKITVTIGTPRQT